MANIRRLPTRQRIRVSRQERTALDAGRVSVVASSGVPTRATSGGAAQSPAVRPEAQLRVTLLHEGRSVIDIARQLGHDACRTLTRYNHVIDELEDQPRLEAEAAIAEARRVARTITFDSVRQFGS